MVVGHLTFSCWCASHSGVEVRESPLPLPLAGWGLLLLSVVPVFFSWVTASLFPCSCLLSFLGRSHQSQLWALLPICGRLSPILLLLFASLPSFLFPSFGLAAAGFAVPAAAFLLLPRCSKMVSPCLLLLSAVQLLLVNPLLPSLSFALAALVSLWLLLLALSFCMLSCSFPLGLLLCLLLSLPGHRGPPAPPLAPSSGFLVVVTCLWVAPTGLVGPTPSALSPSPAWVTHLALPLPACSLAMLSYKILSLSSPAVCASHCSFLPVSQSVGDLAFCWLLMDYIFYFLLSLWLLFMCRLL